MAQSRFLDQTLLTVAKLAEHALFSEFYARKKGLLQSLDLRVKLASFLALIVLVSLLHSLAALWLAYGAALAVSILRVTGQRHFPSDVVLGGTLGDAVGQWPAAEGP